MLPAPRQNALAMFALLGWSASARASEHRVPSEETPTVEQAVALSEPGDVIRIVGAVEVAEPMVVPHNLTVRGGVVPVHLSSVTVPSGVELVLVDAIIQGDTTAACLGLCVMGGLTGTRVQFSNAPLDAQSGVVLLDDSVFAGAAAQTTSSDSVLTLTRPAYRDVTGPAVAAFNSTVVAYDVVMNDTLGTGLQASGGSVTVWGGEFSGAVGPAIDVTDAPATLLNVSFVGQRAEQGAAIRAASVHGSTLAVDGLTAVDLQAGDAGAVIYADGMTTAIARWDLTDTHASRGGAIAVVGGSLNATNGAVSDFSALEAGGMLWAVNAQVVVADLDAVGPVGHAAEWGGLIASHGGSLSVQDVRATQVGAAEAGGVVFGSGALLVTHVEATDASAARGGVVAWANGTATLSRLMSWGSRADVGAVVHLSQVYQPIIQDGVWVDAVATAHAGGAWIEESTGGWLRRMRLCGLQSTEDGAGLLVSDPAAGTLHVVNNILIDNSAEEGGTLAFAGAAETRVQVRNNAVLTDGSSAVIATSGPTVEVLNNLVASATAPLHVGDDAVASGGFNVWPANSARWPNAMGSDRSIDPGLAPYRGALCEHPAWLDADSSLRDAGSPQVYDADGSRSDIGAHGGPHARLTDADEDGHSVDLDCDDQDPSVFPGAVDTPYDGLDQDCDGYDNCDVDGDGVRAVQCGGMDCDDADASVGPDQADSPYDGVDQDCDGTDLIDADGDGWVAQRAGGLDCDDGDPDIHPDASEQPGNDVDENCDGALGDAFLAGGASCSATGRGAVIWPLVWLLLARRRRE